MRLFRTKKPDIRLDRRQALECVPVITSGVQWHSLENGDILIEYPIALKPLLQAIFKRFNQGKTEEMTKKLQLDKHGSRVFSYINGRRNVMQIIEDFADETTLSKREAELSVTAFLRELGRRGILVLK